MWVGHCCVSIYECVCVCTKGKTYGRRVTNSLDDGVQNPKKETKYRNISNILDPILLEKGL